MSHVLVVEDDPSAQRLLQKELAAHDFEVTVASDGLDGLMKLESLQPDVIVCDVNMPNLDGIAFTKALRENDRTRHIPVIFLSASSDPRQIIDGINVGARFYVTKPFQMKELIWKIKRVLPEGTARRRANAAH
jgi:DNA-binding response OmpR family regulator